MDRRAGAVLLALLLLLLALALVRAIARGGGADRRALGGRAAAQSVAPPPPPPVWPKAHPAISRGVCTAQCGFFIYIDVGHEAPPCRALRAPAGRRPELYSSGRWTTKEGRSIRGLIGKVTHRRYS